MQFNDKSRKFALDLMTQLESGPSTPSALVERTGASRAKVMRMLSYLLDKGMVVKTQTGPNALYAKPQPLDFENLVDAAFVATESLVTVDVSVQDAQLLVDALEVVTRCGMGQWSIVEEQFRWDRFGSLEPEAINSLAHALAILKYEALGFSGAGNWGIYSENVHPTAMPLWQMQRAMRHRLAWDRTPQGGLGVHFDEPLGSEMLKEFTVTSVRHGGGVRVCLTAPAERLWEIQRALLKYVQLAKGNVGILLDSQPEGLCPRPREEHICHSLRVEGALKVVQKLMGAGAENGELALSPSTQRIAGLAEVLGTLLSDDSLRSDIVQEYFIDQPPQLSPSARAVRAGPLPLLGTLNTDVARTPEGWGLGKEGGAYRVLKFDDKAGTLVAVGASHSLQTALCMLKNASQDKPLRTYSF